MRLDNLLSDWSDSNSAPEKQPAIYFTMAPHWLGMRPGNEAENEVWEWDISYLLWLWIEQLRGRAVVDVHGTGTRPKQIGRAHV